MWSGGPDVHRGCQTRRKWQHWFDLSNREEPRLPYYNLLNET